MESNSDILKKILIHFLRILNFTLYILIFVVLFSTLVPQMFNFIYGEEVINETLINFVEITNPDEKALAIMAWERRYFDNPYSFYNQNSTLQKFGIYNISGDYRWFGGRPAPVSWIINSRLANCEEYARVFVTLMNNAGIKANLIKALGEDHVWAEYMYDSYRVAVDPSQNIIIGSRKREFEKDMNIKFSYVEAVDLQGTIMDVSDEYIERGNLTIFVFNNEKPVSNAQVIIKNPSFMENRSDRYNKPLRVLSKTTGNDGEVYFKLGYQKYNVEVRVNHIYLLDSVYRKNATVEINKENLINFSLENNEKNTELFITRYI